MTERQFLWTMKNRSRRTAQFVTDAPLGRVVREIAREVRSLERAAEAWRGVARPDWLGAARAVEVRDGMLIVEVDSPVLLERIRRQQAALGRQISKQTPGVRGLRAVRAGAAEDAEDGEAR